MDVCIFRTLHEYRVSIGTVGLSGIATGIVDALAHDWAVKAFLWVSILVVTMFVVAYELTMMPVPERAMLQSMLLVTVGFSGLIGVHHFTWLYVYTMVGGRVGGKLWLAPNIYMDFTAYTCLAGSMLAVYTAYLLYINICSAD